MGMDVFFDREAAEKAGMTFEVRPRCTPEEREEILRMYPHDRFYCEWAEQSEEIAHIPHTDIRVENTGYDCVCLRANRWGRVYEPLTDWLKANGIEWAEG